MSNLKDSQLKEIAISTVDNTLHCMNKLFNDIPKLNIQLEDGSFDKCFKVSKSELTDISYVQIYYKDIYTKCLEGELNISFKISKYEEELRKVMVDCLVSMY